MDQSRGQSAVKFETGEMHAGAAKGRVLHGLIRDTSEDIVVRLDADGFILNASDNAAELGIDLPGLLFAPHIGDLAMPGHRADIVCHADRVFAGQAINCWIEFPVQPFDIHSAQSPQCPPQWYAFSLRMMESEPGEQRSALGLLRRVEPKRGWQSEITHSTSIDPLTGLANRHVLFARMQQALSHHLDQTLVIFAIDRLRALALQYGQRTADEIIWGFAKFLQSMAMPGQEVGQLDPERFAILLPGMSQREAKGWARDVLQTFAGLVNTPSQRTPDLSASAGLAKVKTSVESTTREAEVGLVLAVAGGGNRVGISSKSAGAPIRKAVGGVVAKG